jgi:hypothetical protein
MAIFASIGLTVYQQNKVWIIFLFSSNNKSKISTKFVWFIHDERSIRRIMNENTKATLVINK